jgi:hypothetical protein
MRNFVIQSGEVKLDVEFATEEWIDLAALLVLPDAGYRVHVIREPESPPAN